MNARALHQSTDGFVIRRWSVCAAVVVALHAGAILAGAAWYAESPPPGTDTPAILIDMAPVSSAPAVQPTDLPPGPDMDEAEAPAAKPPEPPKAEIEQPIAPTPPQENPVVAASPEQAQQQPSPPTPQPAKPQPDVVKPQPTVEQKPDHQPTKNPSDRPPAPRTSATPSAEKQAAVSAASRAGAAAVADVVPSYNARLAAHLKRFKQYPDGAKAGEKGTVRLSFTVSRNGQVLSSSISKSSGYPLLDAEALAMIRRAQPLPSFPREMSQASMSFSIPVYFTQE